MASSVCSEGEGVVYQGEEGGQVRGVEEGSWSMELNGGVGKRLRVGNCWDLGLQGGRWHGDVM